MNSNTKNIFYIIFLFVEIELPHTLELPLEEDDAEEAELIENQHKEEEKWMDLGLDALYPE